MLKINNLTVTTLKGRILINNFSFVLNNGDKVALIGEEGNGKSTLLKIMAGIDVSEYVSVKGDIISSDRSAYLPQQVSEEFWDMDVISFICPNEEPDYQRLYRLVREINIYR